MLPVTITDYWDRLMTMAFPEMPSHAGEFPTYDVQVKGIKIHFAKTGHGPPLIAIHGWTNNWEGWIPIVPYLKDEFTLYLLDLPGFGNSDNLPHYSVRIAADYIAHFSSRLPAKPSLFSVSMGSFVAADIILRYPDKVKKAILTGPVIKDGKPKYVPEALDIFLKTVNRSPVSQSALKRMIETRAAAYIAAKYLNMYHWNREIVDLYGMIGKKLVRKEAYVEMGISATEYDLHKTLLSIKKPVLLILGDKDFYTSPDFVKKDVLPFNKQLRLSVIPGAGHVTPWEKPEEVASLLSDFLK
ncbi:alpha/beta hydrolase [Patescibacteria group bacterium]|nr:alpha/beta hydrolase [Patescibacteria group bacterium]